MSYFSDTPYHVGNDICDTKWTIKHFLILCITFLFTLAAKTAAHGQIVLPIKEHRHMVYVEGLTLNGKPASFILDTASSTNLLDTRREADYWFTVANQNGMLVGTGGTADRYAVGEYTLTVGAERLGVHFHAMDMGQILQQHQGLNLAGLLGVPFLKFNKAVIDYQNMTLTINK